jgi:hypothetical protein
MKYFEYLCFNLIIPNTEFIVISKFYPVEGRTGREGPKGRVDV